MTNDYYFNDQNSLTVNEDNPEKVIVVIPAYNEETSIEKVVKETYAYVNLIIVCNDGSTDNTDYVLKNINVKHICNSEKKGKGASIRELFREAEKYDPDIIITMDADYQHDPSDIPKFIKEIRENGSSLVIGSRFVKGSETDISRLRLIGLILVNNLQRLLLKCKVRDIQSGYRAFSREAFFIVTEGREEGYNTESEQVFRAVKSGLGISEIPVRIRYEGLITSKKNFILHGFEVFFYILGYYFKDLFRSRG